MSCYVCVCVPLQVSCVTIGSVINLQICDYHVLIIDFILSPLGCIYIINIDQDNLRNTFLLTFYDSTIT